MTPRRDLVAPATLLLAFGLAPWIDVGAYLLAERTLDRMSRSDAQSLGIAVAVSVIVGSVAALVALVLGIFAAARSRREARDAARSTEDGPRRARAAGRVAGTIARGASLIAVVGVWGPFGVAMLQPFTATSRDALFNSLVESYLVAGVTVAATIAGVVLLVRSRRQRAS